MILYPTIELQNGRPVSLYRGRLDAPQIWHVDPVEKALGFAAAGASWLQITDFDRIAGTDDHAALIEEIVRKAGIPVQLAGGLRSREQVETWIDRGIGRVVLGTLAVYDPALVRTLAHQFPDQVVIAVDVWQGKVMAEGWQSVTSFTPEDFVAAYDDLPLAGLMITDIDNDVEDGDAALGLIAGLAGRARAPVIANGLIRSLDDIARLKYVRGVAGAVVGRALFRKTFALADALALAAAPLEPVAEFL